MFQTKRHDCARVYVATSGRYSDVGPNVSAKAVTRLTLLAQIPVNRRSRRPRTRARPDGARRSHAAAVQFALRMQATRPVDAANWTKGKRSDHVRPWKVFRMMEPAKYSSIEVLRGGRRLEVRALRPDDRADFLAAVDRVAAPSLYRRFLGAKRGFTDREVAFFSDVDFVNHVALVAVMEEAGREVIVGGGRYIVVQPGQAEVAFTIIDGYQGLVPRFRSSHHSAARSFANFGIEGH